VTSAKSGIIGDVQVMVVMSKLSINGLSFFTETRLAIGFELCT
jgi:hypothetical protein